MNKETHIKRQKDGGREVERDRYVFIVGGDCEMLREMEREKKKCVCIYIYIYGIRPICRLHFGRKSQKIPSFIVKNGPEKMDSKTCQKCLS